DLFAKAIHALTEEALILKGAGEFPEVDPALFQVPSPFNGLAPWKHLESSPTLGSECVQHGDMSPGHMFMEQATGRVEIIDWSHARRGYPPLYDCFSL